MQNPKLLPENVEDPEEGGNNKLREVLLGQSCS